MIINEPATYEQLSALRGAFNAPQKPFRYVVIEPFLVDGAARQLDAQWPKVDLRLWVDSNFLNQRNKYTQPVVAGTVAASFFDEIASPRFLNFIEDMTGIHELLPDPEQYGGGYHDVFEGGFLNVHVDFNKHDEHPELDRRLNIILYINPEWREEYGGCLELWDMKTKSQVEKIAPVFNRCVIFETNEVSYHGHPEPVKTSGAVVRRSLAAYYYSRGRNDIPAAPPHGTRYVITTGLGGYARLLMSTAAYVHRRIRKSGLRKVLASACKRIGNRFSEAAPHRH